MTVGIVGVKNLTDVLIFYNAIVKIARDELFLKLVMINKSKWTK
jgi:hypothetical protein